MSIAFRAHGTWHAGRTSVVVALAVVALVSSAYVIVLLEATRRTRRAAGQGGWERDERRFLVAPEDVGVATQPDELAPGGEAIAMSRSAGPTTHRSTDVTLRALDLVVSATALALLLPVIAVILGLVLVASGRPLFYAGERVGWHGRMFTMRKVRTLVADADTRIGGYYGAALDQRLGTEVTRLGRVLRATHLDEIPQLWNVLRGRHVRRGAAAAAPSVLRGALRGDPAVLAAAHGAAGPDGPRPDPRRSRHRLGREAGTRPRVDRRPLDAVVPPHRGADGVADRGLRGASGAARWLVEVAEDAGRVPAMCGISGIVSSTGAATEARAAAMCATLAHRGPDSSGVVADGTFALAARRLAIIDLESGDQPTRNEDGTVHVVQNGEIFNYAELRDGLARDGHVFRSHGDTEVLAHLYEQHGDGFAARLRGMFAVAIWDARQRRLVLARDRFGIKPLYYSEGGGELCFASELRALPRGEVDLDALESFLSFNVVPGPLTILRGCRKLPPGHLLVWEDGRIRLERYADATPSRRGRSARARQRCWRRSSASACATPCAPTSSRTSRWACCSRAGSTRP